MSLQVEHPVTEMITRQDLVEWQLRVAAGERLPLGQSEIGIHGHAFEARVYAEDPARDFLPVTGRLQHLEPPEESPNVRVDTGVVQGDEIGIHYDPMIAKLVVWDESRERALARLRKALADYRIGGLTTNLPFLHGLASVPAFAAGEVHTGFIAEHHAAIFHERSADLAARLPVAALLLLLDRERAARRSERPGDDPHSPWRLPSGWRSGEPRRHRLAIALDGLTHIVTLEEIGEGSARRWLMPLGELTLALAGTLEGETLRASIDGHTRRLAVAQEGVRYTVFDAEAIFECALAAPDFGEDRGPDASQAFAAPMNGAVVAWLVDPGQPVARGDTLMVIEAMKMEHAIRAPGPGSVREFFFRPGDLVGGGARLLDFEAADGGELSPAARPA